MQSQLKLAFDLGSEVGVGEVRVEIKTDSPISVGLG